MDLNLIAFLLPAAGNRSTLDAICMRENGGRYVPPQEELECDSRESTVSIQHEDDPSSDTESYPQLQLAFNPGPKAGQGFLFGTDKNCCDIVLPRLNEISRRHCYLTFDAERRLILRDISTRGTIVTYDGKGGERRRHFTWILSGDQVSEVKKIVIQIQKIQFQIVISKHEAHSDQYVDNVDRFLLQGNADDELPFGALGIQSGSSTAN
ncbi:hypothetical protein G7Y89_g14971 [Cudoniella acicularis]|uniref:FHA domain-containing protein n=1 Tax=Cudoniella acicularis TaxID=354080 RepID=A0A8H4QWJ0_9HELO|nr:hypothetical protein G7Y89_g14971 [Cudoniella acicularis]